MKTIMLTLVIMSLIREDKGHQQKYWESKELNTKEPYIYVSHDTDKVHIGDTLLFPMQIISGDKAQK